MRQQRNATTTMGNGSAAGSGQAAPAELPPNFKPCSLKGRPFTPTFDTSCHNTQGIDVWANKGPRPYPGFKSSTLPRNLGQARAGGELPPQVLPEKKVEVVAQASATAAASSTTTTG